MASVASQLIEEVTAHAQSDSLEDAREICADGTYFPYNLRTTELGYNVMKGSEYSVSLYLSVVITDQYNVMADGEELIGTKE